MALSVSIVCKTFNIKKMHIEKAEYSELNLIISHCIEFDFVLTVMLKF